MKIWLRNWLRRLLSEGNIGPRRGFDSGNGEFNFLVVEAQNGWVISYSQYNPMKETGRSYVRIAETLAGVTDEITVLLTQHALQSK